MISREHKAIFIHIHKTGGTSIEKFLGLYDEPLRGLQDHRKIKEIEQIPNIGFNLKKAAICLYKSKYPRAYYYAKNIVHPEISREEYDQFYKFTFVRNTWSRIHSWYYNLKKDPYHFKKYRFTEDYSFSDFIKYKIDHKTFTQLDFIRNKKGEIPLDFIGRFDKLESDFEKICKDLNIPFVGLPNLLKSNKDFYTEVYNEESKDLIYKYYKDEIDFFGFEFGE